jgi:hypothetical protein
LESVISGLDWRLAILKIAAAICGWRIAAYKTEVNVSCGSTAPPKFSFHESGICRDAFTP